ncbi:hypothetical protein ACH4TM_17670 [Streptomyces parvus]|uniref:hypothetical protein n=1 Tax=Streptomyces parvus TaxID=66428 RepID=UPI00332BA597
MSLSDQPGRPDRKPFLYVVVCAAGVARDVDRLFVAARALRRGAGRRLGRRRAARRTGSAFPPPYSRP